MKHDEKAKRIIHIRNRQAKLTRLMHHYAAQLVALDADLCDAMSECLCDAELSPEVAAKATEPKDGGGK